ncbi:MAG: type I 3-dehydroquinate dehydratase [Bacteroidales bacterium]|nr:type I 3-dehydroquinate dehydratase [Bacteroidales bacterium]
MICTTIEKKSYEEICGLVEGLEMAEIRLDRCNLTLSEIDEIFAAEIPTVATCRIAEIEQPFLAATLANSNADEIHRAAIAECRNKLVEAVRTGAAYADVEDDAPQEVLDAVKKAAEKFGSTLIVSHHDFSRTPSYGELKEAVMDCFRKGAEVAKIATMAKSAEDVARVMRLYEDFDPTKLLAFCMGEVGRDSRVECLRRGARFTYAALDGSEPAASGQWPTSEITKAVYGDRKPFGSRDYRFFLPKGNSSPQPTPWKYGEDYYQGSEAYVPDAKMPASKSFAQRAIIAAALAEGESHLHGYTPCFDSEAAIAVARKLGAEVVVDQSDITVRGIAASPESLDIDCLNVGESGLLARLMIPLAAVLSTRDVTIEGEGTLRNRPLTTTDEIMSRFGIRLSSDTVPLKISGTFTEGNAVISGRGGSQLISGLLMACPLAATGSVIKVTEPKSIPYMFITVDALRKFGALTEVEMDGGGFTEEDGGWGDCKELTFRTPANLKYKAADMDLEGDWSAAANFLVAAAVFGRTILAGLDTTSLQADISIMDILIGAGANPIQLDGDMGPLLIRRFPLTAFEADLADCPDLFPITAVFAAFCGGTSRIDGIDRLAHKESDRGAAIVEMLTQMGVKTSVEGNTLVIEGHSLDQRLLTNNLLRGGNYTSHHDHRMVMALKVASLGADGPITIDDEACVGKSFPAFNEIFQSLI